MPKYQVEFACVTVVEASSKGEATALARNSLLYEDLNDYVDLSDPIIVSELDKEGDPIL